METKKEIIYLDETKDCWIAQPNDKIKIRFYYFDERQFKQGKCMIHVEGFPPYEIKRTKLQELCEDDSKLFTKLADIAKDIDFKQKMTLIATKLDKIWPVLLERPEDDEVEKMVVEKGSDGDGEKKFSDDTQERINVEVERLLNCKNVIYKIDKHLSNMIAGEENNRIFVFIVGYSGKTPLKLMLIALHEMGVGKSYLLRTIAKLFLCYIPSHITDRALNYVDEEIQGKEIFFLKELGNMDNEENKSGPASIKMISLEDEGLKTLYAYRDEKTGRFKTQDNTINPMTVFTTSTRNNIKPEFLRRNWIICPDESLTQTILISEFEKKQRIHQNMKKQGLIEITDFEFSQAVLREYLKRLTPANIIIPFDLNDELDKTQLRVRGDFKKLKILLELYGNICRNDLPRIEKNGKTFYIMTPDKAIEILKLSKEPLKFMANATDRRLYSFIQSLKTVEKDKNLITYKEPTQVNWIDIKGHIDSNIQYILADINHSNIKTVKNKLKELENRGYLFSFQGEHGANNYVLVKTVDEIDSHLGGYGFLESEEYLSNLKEKLRKQMNAELEQYGIEKISPAPPEAVSTTIFSTTEAMSNER